MTEDEAKKHALRKKLIIVAVAGVVLALACRVLPVEYQKPCQTIVALCTGGL